MGKEVDDKYIKLNNIEIVEEGKIKDEITLLKAEKYEGRGFEITPTEISSILLYQAERELEGLKMPIDYEHQTFNSVFNGQPAPSAGWVKMLWADDGAIKMSAKWNKKAQDFILNDEYKYLSPVIAFNERHWKTGEELPAVLVNIALTNIPYLPYTSVANKSNTIKEDIMDKKVDVSLQELQTENELLKKQLEEATVKLTAFDEMQKKVETDNQLIKDLEKKINDMTNEKKVDADIIQNRIKPARKELLMQTLNLNVELYGQLINSFKEVDSQITQSLNVTGTVGTSADLDADTQLTKEIERLRATGMKQEEALKQAYINLKIKTEI